MSVINTNVASLNAQRNLSTSSSGLATSLQRRSSGLRARELKIEKDAAGSRIEPVDRAGGAIVYEFRIAHR